MIPAVLGMLIIRKPGAALFCETVAATGELIMGSQYGTTVLISGILQGLGAELIFAAFLYKKFNLPVSAAGRRRRGPLLRPERFLPAVGLEHRLRSRRQARLHRLHARSPAQ